MDRKRLLPLSCSAGPGKGLRLDLFLQHWGGHSWQRLDLTALFSDDWPSSWPCLSPDQEGFKEPPMLRPGLPAGRDWWKVQVPLATLPQPHCPCRKSVVPLYLWPFAHSQVPRKGYQLGHLHPNGPGNSAVSQSPQEQQMCPGDRTPCSWCQGQGRVES